jgi:siderophore synthetase component
MNLNREERRVLGFLRQHAPALTRPFLTLVPGARKTILDRLATSMLWEDVAEFATDSYELEVHDSESTEGVAAIDEERRRVADSLRAHGPQSGATYKVIVLSAGEHLVIPAKRPHAFGRFEVEGQILHVRRRGVRPLQHAVELLRIVRVKESGGGSDSAGAWSKFARELSNGSANLALARAYQEVAKRRLQRIARACGADTTLALIETLKARDEDYDSSLFFEQLCAEGHRIHPGAKTKIGMDPEAVYRYAPELEGQPAIKFVGIRKDHAESATLGAVHTNTTLFEQCPELREAIDRQFTDESGLSAVDYVFAPVHPWQLEHVVPVVYEDELAADIVVPVANFSVPSDATTSFRTLVPRAAKSFPKLAAKTSVESQMTSTTRSISSNTAQNAPEFSRLILAIMHREPELAKTFVPVPETAGISFKVDPAERDAERRTIKSRNLSVVLREDVETFVRPGELAIVGSSLYSSSPLTGKSMLAELVEEYAGATGNASMREAALGFVAEYSYIALPGYLSMMVKYGIGLEGHLQNVVPVFRHGRPVRLLFRDWGGTRVHTERLTRQGLALDLRPGSVTVAKDAEEMRNKVFYTVYQNHVAEVVIQACKHFEVSERELWRSVYEVSDAVMGRLASDPEHAEDARRDREALFRAEVGHKALTRMRLSREGGDIYVSVPNPLYRFDTLS